MELKPSAAVVGLASGICIPVDEDARNALTRDGCWIVQYRILFTSRRQSACKSAVNCGSTCPYTCPCAGLFPLKLVVYVGRHAVLESYLNPVSP